MASALSMADDFGRRFPPFLVFISVQEARRPTSETDKTPTAHFILSLSHLFWSPEAKKCWPEEMLAAVDGDDPRPVALAPDSSPSTANDCRCAHRWLLGPRDFSEGRLCWKARMSSRPLFLLIREVRRSESFRRRIFSKVFHPSAPTSVVTFRCPFFPLANPVPSHMIIRILLRKEYDADIDKLWNYRMVALIRFRIELEEMMAWLSTLGGAYSCLGEHFTDCAKAAGSISLHQFKLAVKLGDPVTVSQCKLYLALSFIQLRRLKKSERLIRDQYAFAKTVQDSAQRLRLENMCKGIWAKLKHTANRIRDAKKKMYANGWL